MMNNNIEDYFTKINFLIHNIEFNLKKCSKKFKDKQEIDYLYADLSNFLVQENVNDSKLQDELLLIEKDLRKSNSYNEYTRQKINEYKEKIRNLNIELKSLKTLLEKSSINWTKFRESFELVRKWLNDQERVSDISKTDLNNYQRFQKLHVQFCESANFILQTSDASTSAKIREKLLYLNKAWKTYQDRFKDTQYDQFLKYYECEQSLNMIMERLTKIELLTQKQCKCNLNAVSKYQEELQKAFNDVECLDANLKLLNKLINRLDLRHDPSLQVNDLYEGIRSSEAKLNKIRQVMPEFLKSLTKTCTQISSIEEGLQQIENWVIDGDNLLKSDPDQLSFDQISKHIEKQKKHFNDYSYYENSILNKTHSLQSLKTLATPNFDYNDLTLKLFRVKELLLNLNSRRLRWEEQFEEQQALWKHFHHKTKLLEEWIINAQKIVSEKNDDYNFLLHKHKEFFDNVDRELINGFLHAGERLLHVKNQSDIAEIKVLMDTLSGQWQMILAHAPVRLLKLQFKRLEVLLKSELKAADIEISEECLALNKNVDLQEILKRHEAKFKHSDFFNTCETYLQGMRTCSKELSEKKTEEKSNVEEILDYLQNYWKKLTKKIETMNAKLTILPDTKENFEIQFNVFANWLYELEQNWENLSNNNLPALSDYRRLSEKCQSAISELDSKQEQLAILTTQYDYLHEQNILSDEIGYHLQQLKNRYLRLVELEITVQNRIAYLEQIIIIAHNSDALANKTRNLSALSARRFMAEEDDNSIQTAIHEHHTVIDQMRLFESEINNLKEEACKISDDNLLHLPAAIYEKIVSTQDLIKQNLTEELERQASLMEIKESTDTKLNKMETLNKNLEIVKNILDKKTPDELGDELNFKNTDSYEEEKINLNHIEYSKYLLCIAKTKEVIQNSKSIITNLKDPLSNSSGANSPTQTYQEVRELEIQIDKHLKDVESQIDLFEANLAVNQKLDCKFEKINKDLENLKENFRMYELKLSTHDETTKETIENLGVEYDKLRIDMDQINKLKCELNALHYDMNDLMKSNALNLKNSKIAELCQGFNEVINELDTKKNTEMNAKLEIFSKDVGQLEEDCLLKIADYKFQIEQFKINKKQSALDIMTNTIDLELDNLVNMKYFNEEDDLLIESEDILLDKVEGDDAQMELLFNKVTEIDIEEECFQDESQYMENTGCIDVRISRECLETNYNTSLDGESFNTINKALTDTQLQNSREALNRSQIAEPDCNIPIIHENVHSNEASIVEHSSQLNGFQIEIERESMLKKSVTFADENILVETNKSEQISEPDNDLVEEKEQNLIEQSIAKELEREHKEQISNEQLKLTLKKKESMKEAREKERARTGQEKADKEKERLECLRIEQEKLDKERVEREKAEIEQKLEWENLEKERLERDRIAMDIKLRETHRIEAERMMVEKQREKEELERQRLAKEAEEKARLEQELIQKEIQKREREKERQRQELERIEKEKEMIQRRLEKQRADKEKFEQERLERELFLKTKEQAEIKRIETERLEMEKAIKQRELERQEMERMVKEKERADAERAERDQKEREEINRQKEALKAERLRIEELERQKLEKIQKELALELERKEKDRLEQERLLKLETQRLEKERLEREKLEQVIEKQRIEKDIMAKELEREKQRLEFDKRQLDIERFDQARSNEFERIQWERQEQLRIDWERKQIYEQQQMQSMQRQRLPAVLEEIEDEQNRSINNRISPYGSRTCSPVRSRNCSPVKSRNCSPIKSRETSPIKSTCISPVKSSENLSVKSRECSPIKSREASPVKSILKNGFYDQDEQNIESTYHIDPNNQETYNRFDLTDQQKQKRFKIENNLKDLCDNFNYLKDKISQVGEIHQSHSETKLLILNLEKELQCLNTEMHDLTITCDISGDASNGLDQATLTQFDLIKSFAAYLANQLDDKSREYQVKVNQTAHIQECEQNLIKYIELAVKFYKPSGANLEWIEKDLGIRLETSTDEANYVENINDLENRISQIESIEDSISNFLNQMSESPSSVNTASKFSKIIIESNILQPLSTHCADLKKFLIHWKQFDRDFNKLKCFLNNEIKVDVLLKEGDLNSELGRKLKCNFIGFLEKDFQKYSSLRERLVGKVSESERLFAQGSALFDPTLGQRACVLAQNAVKEFNETRDIIKEACQFLDEKCFCLNYVLKCEVMIKDLVRTLNKITLELDRIEDEKTYGCVKSLESDLSMTEQCLIKAKSNVEMLGNLKAEFKVAGDEKDMMPEIIAKHLNGKNVSCSNLEAFNRKVNFEARQKMEKLFNVISIRFATLEVQYQEEIMKTLPSRSALSELVDWLHSRIDTVENLFANIGVEKSNSLGHLESCKKKLIDISDEMKNGRESSLKFIRNSIEDEIKQGFYDLTVSELMSKTERDWNRLKQKISNDMERLELSLVRINEFDRNVKQMQVWIQNQLSTEQIPVESTPNQSGNQSFLLDDMKSLNIIDDDKKILIQISNYKELLSRLEVIWQQERNELQNSSENSRISQLVQEHMSTNLDELKSNLQSMELISKLKIENNLSQIKQTYTIESNELNAALESEVNFVNFGKIVSRQQYETTIKKISEILKKLYDTRSKMQSILNKFDAELKSSQFDLSCTQKLNHSDVLSIVKTTIDSYDTTGLLDNLKKSTTFSLSNLHMESLENSAQKLVSQAQTSILPVWIKYDDAYQCLQKKINETNQSYLVDLDKIDRIDVSSSNLFQDKLKEMMENRRLFEQFNATSDYLIEKFAPNENTKNQLKLNKQNLQDQFGKLSVLADRLKTKFESSLKEHQNYTKLINEVNILNEEASKLITNFNIDKLNKHKNLHNYLEKFGSCERHLNDTLEKFKSLNIKDTHRITKIYEATNPSTNLLLKLRESRMSLMDCVQERHNLVQSKLNDIELYLDNYQAKRTEEATLAPETLNPNDNYVHNKNLNKLINCLKYMLAHNISLSKYETQLDELMTDGSNLNAEELYIKMKSLKHDRILKFRKQLDFISMSNGLYDNLTSLNCLNEDLNTMLEKSMENSMKNIDKFRAYNDNFHRIRCEIEKNIFNLQEEGLGFIDFRNMKSQCLDLIESFYIRILSDIESVSGKVERYSILSHQLESSLKQVETQINNKIEYTMSKLDGIIEKNNLDDSRTNDFENMESRLNYLKSIKEFLTGAQLKTDIEIIQQLGNQLQQKGLIDLIQKKHSDYTKQQSSHEAIRIKYLDLTCKIDMEVKDLEQEFAKWKSIVNKSTKLLSLIRSTHEQLAKISLSNKCDRINSTEINNQSCSFNTSDILNGLDDMSTNSLEYRIELKDNKSLSQLVDYLKFEVLTNLNENEGLKQEIVDLSYKSSMKSSSIRAIVNNVLDEWKLVNQKANSKIAKLEKFMKSLNDLDGRLNKVREQIFNWETYLNQECFADMDLVDFQTIISKKNDLESLLETLKKKDTEIQHLFKVCLNANRSNLSGNKQNQQLIVNLKERWSSLKTITKDKLFLIQNLWMLLTDLNDQMENFYMVLEKTENFYRNTVNVGNNPRIVFKLIQELYFTIQDDFKLIKYLNESFVNFSKLANYFSFFELLEKLKQKFMSLNNEWDSLHNEIAVQIKNSRKYENQIMSPNSYVLSKEKITTWISEISLLITNLEYLSTNELKLKFNDVVDLKKEICEQTGLIFKDENILKDEDELIERIKEIMKRIIRLDSYLQQSSMSPPLCLLQQSEIRQIPQSSHQEEVTCSKPSYMQSFESLF